MNPVLLVLLLFVLAPLGELYVLIEVGGEIGAGPTILLSLFTAFLGGWLVRMQGLSVLFRVQQTLAVGELPAVEMLEGAVLMVTGVLLLLPGFITDAAGFLMLVPPLRRGLIIWLLRHANIMRPVARSPEAQHFRHLIEGEYKRHDDSDDHRG